MTDGEALLRAILENPADDTARLVYADWLEENGRGVWAGFIRHQIGSPVSPCRNAPLTALLSLEPVVGPLPHQYASNVSGVGGAAVTYPDGMEFWFRRGFVSEVRLPLAEFLTHAETLFRAHPVERVVLTDRGPLRFEGRWLWHNAGHPLCVSDDADDYLPGPLFGLLKDHIRKAARVSSMVKGYRTVTNATDALSAACAAYGRSLAGLPPLPAEAAPWA